MKYSLCIEPIFEEYDKIIIDLDDLYGCPSSFREEAFGGLARKFGKSAVLSKLELNQKDRDIEIERSNILSR